MYNYRIFVYDLPDSERLQATLERLHAWYRSCPNHGGATAYPMAYEVLVKGGLPQSVTDGREVYRVALEQVDTAARCECGQTFQCSEARGLTTEQLHEMVDAVGGLRRAMSGLETFAKHVAEAGLRESATARKETK